MTRDISDIYNPISLVRASAGTGKTFFLTDQTAKLLSSSVDAFLNIRGTKALELVATTFTNKAADELMQRMQSSLVALGDFESAHFLRGSYIGTVNSVCGRLVSDYALSAGFSPSITVIDEVQQRKLFFAACESVFGQFTDRLNDLGSRLSLEDWRADVFQLIELTRQNDLTKEDIRSVASRSWNRLNALLPDPFPEEYAKSIDAELAESIQDAICYLENSDDESKYTKDALDYLCQMRSSLESHGFIAWSSWVRIAKLKYARKTEVGVASLTSAASKYSRHPRLLSDWRDMIDQVVSCAVLCFEAYSEFKLKHGLIDFVDEELLAKSLLCSQQLNTELSERFKVLMVDEFQDTSPIQLAVFLKLAESVRASLWVGDDKQSIYSFRGADPALTQRVCSQLIGRSGGSEQRLSVSYRSRPELVSFANSLFSRCMPPVGIQPDTVSVSHTERESTHEMNDPIHFWWLAGKTIEESLKSLAAGVTSILGSTQEFIVQDKASKLLRPVVGSDIVILCRSNEHRIRIATQLVSDGVLVATDRGGLLNTAECSLAVAALRFMLDPYDTLAAGIVLRFTGEGDEWLSDWIERGFSKFSEANPILRAISNQRWRIMHLTPVETVELAIFGTGVIEIVKRLGNFRQRAMNLDALRGLARGYESDCLATRRAATAAGLVAFLQNRSLENMQPPNPDARAVNVLTYHKAKGFEWPIVILYDLDSVKSGTAFGVAVEQNDVFDALNPLAGRSLRYWPWPFGKHRDVDFGNTARTSKEFVSSARNQHAESVRLMYVGVTRARDYLIFAARNTPDGTAWLKQLKDETGQSVLTLSCETGNQEILSDSEEVHCAAMRILTPNDCQPLDLQTKASIFTSVPLEGSAAPKVPYRVTPSQLEEFQGLTTSDCFVSERVQLGPRIITTGKVDLQVVGDVVHLFLAADEPSRAIGERMNMANNLLSSWNVSSLKALDLVTMANRLSRLVMTEFGAVEWLREWPVTGFTNSQRIRGSIDLLLKSDRGYVIIDHKTYPGREDTWESKALSFAPQLLSYKHLIEESGATPVIGIYIHLPLVGQMLKLSKA